MQRKLTPVYVKARMPAMNHHSLIIYNIELRQHVHIHDAGGRSIQNIVPYCPTVTPPFLRPTSRKKRGESVTTRTCAFASQLSPPPLPRIYVLRSTKLCCAVEDENSFDRHAMAVLKAGRVNCWPRTCCHFFQNIAGSLAARLHPLAARLHGRMTCRITGLRKLSEISENGQDQFSNYFLHA